MTRESDDPVRQNAVFRAILKAIYIQTAYKFVLITKIELQPELAAWQPRFDELVAQHWRETKPPLIRPKKFYVHYKPSRRLKEKKPRAWNIDVPEI